MTWHTRRPAKMTLRTRDQRAWRQARAEVHYREWADAVYASSDGPRIYAIDFYGWSV